MSRDEQGVPTPPEGFLPLERRGAFSQHNGPYFYRPTDDGTVEQAFFALPRHANGLGLVHGGMLSGFMDSLLAAAVIRQLQRPAVTVHLSTDFLHMARIGEWVFGEGRITRAGRDIAFAEGRAFVAGGRDVVRASGVFKLMRRNR